VQSPAVWLVGAVTLAAIGLLPRATVSAAWTVLGACVIISFMAPLLGLPGWVDRLSPYDHVPKLPAVGFDAAPLLVLTAIAAAFAVAGFAGLRRRDVG
jgi:ABC-2 type transport system permease protein